MANRGIVICLYVSAQDLLRTREIELQTLETQVNNIFYWLMMQWNDTYLSTHSRYWNQFEMTNPGIYMPETAPLPGHYVQLLAYSMTGNLVRCLVAFFALLHYRVYNKVLGW